MVRNKVFISYSHKDEKWLKRLDVHLKPLLRDENIDIWDDRRISAGSQWREEIQKALDGAKVAVLLISANFIASDFIINHELPALLNAAREDGAIILPIIIGVSRFSRYPALSKFQAINPPDKPLSKLTRPKQDEYLVRLSEEIERAINNTVLQMEPSKVKEVDVKFDPENIDETIPTKIWFSDFLHPNPISIKLAVLAFESGQKDFVVEWHSENNLLFDTVKSLYENAKDSENKLSKFYGVSPESVLNFIDLASKAIDSSRIKEKIVSRIPLLLEGLSEFYSNSKENVLSNFLVLASLRIHKYLAYATMQTGTEEKYCPEQWVRFIDLVGRDEYRELFEIDEPVAMGRLRGLGDADIDILLSSTFGIYIFAPLIMFIYTYESRKPYDYIFLRNHLIPQVELFMVNHSLESKVVFYNRDQIWIDRILDNHGMDLIWDAGYYENLRLKDPSFFARLVKEGIINESGFRMI